VSAETAPWFLVYSGSTSVGQYAIQLAHQAGYRVITTSSPRHFEFLKTLGANVVVDHNEPEVVSRIKEATDDSISIGIDGFSSSESQKTSIQSFGPGKGHLVTLLPADSEAAALRPDITVSCRSSDY
jgi:NADPH:quinone reductase-like Zn-dependent oxidoreductase